LGSAARSGALPARFFQSSMAISFQSLGFNGSTTTIQQRARAGHPRVKISRKSCGRMTLRADLRVSLIPERPSHACRRLKTIEKRIHRDDKSAGENSSENYPTSITLPAHGDFTDEQVENKTDRSETE
jgi:hypothetical protein